jgi:hypothetical protein
VDEDPFAVFLQGFLAEFIEDLLLLEGVGGVVETLLRSLEDAACADSLSGISRAHSEKKSVNEDRLFTESFRSR